MKHFKSIFTVLLAVILIGSLFLINGCKKKEPEMIKVPAILPLTGPAAFYGEWGSKGMNLAVDEINSKGGINRKKLEIVFGDSKNEPKEGVSWINKFLSEKIPVVISAMTGVSFSVMPVAEKNNTVLFMTIVTHPEAADKSPLAFRHYINKGKAAEKMAEFARNSLKLEKVSVLYINDEGGLGEKNSFRSEFEKLGGEVIFKESFEKTETDLKNHLLKIAGHKPEALYISGYGKLYGLALKQIYELKLKFKVLASYEPLYKTTQELAGPSLEGVFFTSPLFEEGNPESKKFIDAYIKKYGIRPELDAAFGYDVVNLIALAIKNGGYNSEGIKNALLTIKDFQGAVGRINILPNGDTEIPIVIRTIKEGNIVPVKF
jgi:branched-chain amino acid transport system substrate-binding protein